MADSFNCAISNLLCAENNSTSLVDLDCNATNGNRHNHHQDPVFDMKESESLMGFSSESEEGVRTMIERENYHLPRFDYLERLRSGDLDLSVRREALDWIWKAYTHYSLGPLSICLSMNYLDRFLSVYDLPKGKAWIAQLLAVACLSLAAKMEETEVPQCVDIQVGEPKFIFEAKTIQRMELLLLSTLNWRIRAITPCSFIDYFLGKIGTAAQHPSIWSISKSLQLILSTIKGIDFLEFRPSEIAAAVAISVSGEIQAQDIDKAISCLLHVEKGKVLKCIELIKTHSLIGSSGNGASGSATPSLPQSPVGVLDAACLSFNSDGLTTVGSCANSSHNDAKTV